MRSRSFLWLVPAILGSVSCTLIADSTELNGGCRPNEEKACDGRCVLVSDPEYGCASEGCQPCVLPNAQSTCDVYGECAIAACVGRTEDCNRRADDGCEVNLDADENHCGACNAEPCSVPGALPACARGECAIRKCLPGFKDCNRESDDGCEINILEHDENCGGCGLQCTVGLECVDGGCQ